MQSFEQSFEKKKLKLYHQYIFLTTSDWVTNFIEMLENPTDTIVFTMFQTVVNNS